MPSIFIDDSYTIDDVLEAKFGFPAVAFTYRIAHPEKAYTYLREPKTTGKQYADAIARILAEHLVKWDVTAPDGNAVPITEANLRRVAYPILEQLVERVVGYGREQRDADVKN